jgi:peptidoglycan/xylan/chitin deacetylase (PgdA/CDA1 family)
LIGAPIKATLKRVIKLSVSLFVFGSSYIRDALYGLVGKRVPARCVILYYHRVPSEQRSRFARQMDVLVRSVKAIPADGMARLSAGERYAAVTFDDAYQSVLQNAVPELASKKIPATIFVIAGIIGRSPGWDGYQEDTMTFDQLKSLPTDLITIGSHTVTHPALPSIPELKAKEELINSRLMLEKLFDRKIRLFSFPYGLFDEKMFAWCKEAGYDRIFTTLPFWAFKDEAEFATGRVSVEPSDWPIEFYLKLHGAYRWLPWGFSVARMLSARQPEHPLEAGLSKN